MKTHATGVAALLVVAASVTLDADRVRLRSGKVVDGMFIGGDSKNVRILLDDGIVSEVPLAEAVAVEFSSRKPPPPAAPPAAPAAPTKTAPAAPACWTSIYPDEPTETMIRDGGRRSTSGRASTPRRPSRARRSRGTRGRCCSAALRGRRARRTST